MLYKFHSLFPCQTLQSTKTNKIIQVNKKMKLKRERERRVREHENATHTN